MPYIDVSLAVIELNRLTRVEHQGKKFVIVRTEEGGVYAYLDACPHAFWPLSNGTVRGDILECPGHNWEFDVRTGRCINAPDRCLTQVSISQFEDVVRLRWDEKYQVTPSPCETPVSSSVTSS